MTSSIAFGQTAIVKGKVKNELNKLIPGVKIEVLNTDLPFYQSNTSGEYAVRVPTTTGKIRIRFTHSTHDTTVLERLVNDGFTYDETIIMRTRQMNVVVITDERALTDLTSEEQMEVLPIKIEDAYTIPGAVPSVERIAAQVAGGTNNEFSSQYRVRGGNFDENLVYVNGIEIYRPILTRSGQQEGLGFTNANLVQEVKFSTGGFAARYGDRLSSVLDITYRTPEEFKGTAEVGILTTNVHMEGTIRGKERETEGDVYEVPGRFTYQFGGRRFSTTYLLNSLETQGEYRPNFYDIQTMFTYRPRAKARNARVIERKNGKMDTLNFPIDKIKLTSFFVLSRNNYFFEPAARETSFGTIQQAFRLRVGFEGREITSYTTGLGALMLTHRPNARLRFDYTVTAFRAQEAEVFDVEGGYLISEVNTNFGSDEFNESTFDLGIGTEFRHARNFLTANVLAGQFRGEWTTSSKRNHKLFFGAKYEYQDLDDQLREYSIVDSAGYLLGSDGQGFGVVEFIQGASRLTSNNYKLFLQHRWKINPNLILNWGVRGLYYSLIDRYMVAPRAQLIYDFSQTKGGPKLRLRAAGGVYHQPPFYREFRRFDGSLNLDLRAQTSVHAIAGLDYQFESWGRPFRFFSELYYKHLYNLIPYEIQNVRIRYYPDEVADGYAYGVDLRLNGQFIKGVDSWMSLNLLSTRENVEGDLNPEGEPIGFVRRPTDQRFAFSMYFQDELPNNPTYKVHVNYIYGSGLRHGPPQSFDVRTAFGFPSYQRVDLGFSKVISFAGETGKRGVESIWATFEIFNLLQRSNTVSYIWLKDFFNRQFAIPNNLSARLVNFRVVMKFR
ncbi:MAG: TonB-dependent receptor plug domain-containing protein [Bacteroidota bacterium]